MGGNSPRSSGASGRASSDEGWRQPVRNGWAQRTSDVPRALKIEGAMKRGLGLAVGILLLIVTFTATARGQLPGRAIVIGVGGPLTGGAATFGVEMKQGIEMAIDEKNAAGGLLGAKLSLDIANDQANPQTGEAVAQRFCDNPAILGVVGHVNSGVTVAASTVYNRCGLLMITPMSSSPTVTDRGLNNVFRLTNRDDHKGPALASYLYRKLGKRKIVVIDDKTPYGKGLADLLAKKFTDVGGQVVARRDITVGERDFRPLLESLPKDFEAMFFGGIAEGAFILKEMREMGLNQVFTCGDGCWDVKGFIEPSGGAATKGEGVLILSAAPAVGKVRGSKEFAEKYTSRYDPIANYATNSYDSARLVMTAIEAAAKAKHGMPTRAEVLAAMRQLRFQGIAYARPVEWDEKGDNRAAVIFLNIVEGDHFKEIAEVTQSDLAP